MHQSNIIVREPLLDPRQQVAGYELTWQETGLDAGISDTEILRLYALVGRELRDAEAGWLMGKNLLFLEARPGLLSSPFLQQLSSQNIVLLFDRDDILEAAALSALKAAREQGFNILLRNANPTSPDRDLMSQVTHIEVPCGASDVTQLAKSYAALKSSSSVRMVARKVGSWQEYDVCAQLGLDAFVGKLHLTPRASGQSKAMNPSQALILQLMDQVRKNADIRDIEAILKRDPAMSYKLLRYINSAGFGLAAEVQSLRHAVGMIGYTPLYRWLSLLLATSASGEQAAVLMQTAIIRGRFAELIGRDLLPKKESENLFVTGMFSLLDRLLGVSMEDALKHLFLSEDIAQALISREGLYGPILALVEACENKGGSVGDLADSLLISPLQVNKAHLASLAWAQNFTA